jgi:beta propeller repeat protein
MSLRLDLMFLLLAASLTSIPASADQPANLTVTTRVSPAEAMAGGCTITSSKASYVSGANVLLGATPGPNWTFHDWVVTDIGQNAPITTDALNFTMPAVSVTVTAYFTRNSYVQPAVGVEIHLTSDVGDEWDPSISGNHIVFTAQPSQDMDISYYDLATGLEHPVNANSGDQSLSAIDGTKIVYTDYTTADVFLYDTSTGTSQNLTDGTISTAIEAAISGHRVVFSDDRDGAWQIYLKDLDTGTVQPLTSCAPPQFARFPAIDGSHVAWAAGAPQNGKGVWSICLKDLDSSGPDVVIADGVSSPDYPYVDVDGDIVAYCAGSAANQINVYYYRISSGEHVQVSAVPAGTVCTFARVSGDYISYTVDDGASLHVRLYRISNALTMTVPALQTADQFMSDISGHDVVYTDDRNGGYDLYLYRFADLGPQITVTPTTYAFGSLVEGNALTTDLKVINNGNFDLNITGLDGLTAPFSAAIKGSATVVPGGTGTITVTFKPSAAGSFASTLTIDHNDVDHPPVLVQFTGIGLPATVPPALQITDILAFFDQAVAKGTLVGSGSGILAKARLLALRELLVLAKELIGYGNNGLARLMLLGAYQLVDSRPSPADFAAGTSAPPLANMIQKLSRILTDSG